MRSILFIALFVFISNLGLGIEPQLTSLFQQLEIAETNEDKANIMADLGIAYRSINSDSALYFATTAFDLVRNSNDLRSYYFVGRKLIKVLRNRYELPEAHQVLFELRDRLLPEHDDQFGVWIAFDEAGLELASLQNEYFAGSANDERYIRRLQDFTNEQRPLLKWGEQKGDDQFLSEAYYMFGILKIYTREYDSLIHYGNLAMGSYNRLGNTSEVTNLHHLLARGYANKGDYEAALEEIEVFEHMADSLNEKSQVVRAIITKADYLSKGRSVQEGYDYMIASRPRIEALDLSQLDLKLYYYNRLVASAENLELWKDAYDYQAIRDSLQYQDRFFETEREISELKLQYDVAKKDEELLKATEERNFAIALFLTTTIIGLLIIIFYLIYRQRSRSKEIEQERKISEILRNQDFVALNAMLEGQEGERKRLGRELHDNIGSMLGTLRMQLSAVKEKASALPNISNDLQSVEKLIDDAADETRRLSHNLLSGVLNRFGLVAALRDLSEQINMGQDIIVKFNAIGMDDRLNAMQEVNLYRIAQELITNALKHSFADEIVITVLKKGNAVKLVVRDNGIGLPSEEKMENKGVGISNINGRVKALKGDVNFHTEAGQGTKVEVLIEIKEQNAIQDENKDLHS